MLLRALEAILVARLALAPWAGAQEPAPRPEPFAAASLRGAAAREAVRPAQAAPRRGPMPGGLKWTGIGLLIGSGLPLFAAKFGDCLSGEFSCRDQRHAAYAVAGAMAGTGGALLVIAHAKRAPALPSLVLRDGRAIVQQRIAF